MRTIAVVNQKGGCGKTTVSINLASALAELGQKTLLVDMDPQSHCAVGLAVPEDQVEQSIYDVLISNSRNEPLKLTEILWQIGDNLELAPASIDLSAFDQQMSGVTKRDCCLKNVLEEIKDEFDYTVVDCPPAVGLLTFNALMAATDVIVPVETGYFALHGLSRQLETLNILCQRANHNVNVQVLASMYDIRTKMAREILAELRDHFDEKMFRTTVNFNTKIKEAASFGQPISEYDNTSKGQMDFHNLAKEVVKTETKQHRHGLVNSLASQLESISSTADELLKAAKPPIAEKQQIQIEPIVVEKPQEPKPIKLEEPEEIKPIKVKPAQEVKPIKIEPAQEAKAVETEEKQHINVSSTAQADKPKVSLDAKLSDYYGVNHIDDAVVFVTLYPRAENVKIAGDFNNWQPEKTQMKKIGSSGIWQTKVKLPPGRYRYRLVVDGQWQKDPYNGSTEPNPFGQLNSILEVEK